MSSGLHPAAAQAIAEHAAALVPVVIGAMFIYLLGRFQGALSRSSASDQIRRSLRRDRDWVEVLAETETGYGLAIHDRRHGTELVAFTPDDELTDEIVINDDRLDTVADALSVRACEQEDDADG